MGILARSLPGNLTIWREILTFEIKKYIRNSGKSDYLAGKTTLFQAVGLAISIKISKLRKVVDKKFSAIKVGAISIISKCHIFLSNFMQNFVKLNLLF